MAGFIPAIQPSTHSLDGRHKGGHDGLAKGWRIVE
jgi:hypothetical protein